MTEMMTGMRNEIQKMAPNGLGQRQRSEREKAALFREISKMPEDSIRILTNDMKIRAGHSPNEERPCEVCDMIAKYGLGVK
jgi:hypothetical protein